MIFAIKKITGKVAEEVLGKANITVNKNMVPFDDQSPFVTSGIRVGTAAITTRGLKESEMKNIVELIDKVINNYNNKELVKEVSSSVNSMMSKKPLFLK